MKYKTFTVAMALLWLAVWAIYLGGFALAGWAFWHFIQKFW